LEKFKLEATHSLGVNLFSEILQTVKLRGTIYFQADFCSPWGMDIPQGEYANYHIVTDGNCWLSFSDEQGIEPILLQTGDMVLFPRGKAHGLSDSSSTSGLVAANELIEKPRRNCNDELMFGGDGQNSTRLICGHFEHDKNFFDHPLFSTLPSFVHISANESGQNSWFTTMSELAVEISKSENVGKNAIVDRLAESLFIQTLTEYTSSLDDPTTFLAAAQDKNIGLALKAIHTDITNKWSLAKLADIAIMSQSAFSIKFTDLVGTSPMVYLANWRMLKATEMLKDTRMSISQIAEQVGYQSVFSFSKAFKKVVGETPGSIRKTSQAF